MRFILGLAIGLGLMIAGWGGALFLQAGRPTLSSQWVADVYALKAAAAEKIGGPKIVIVAGSNALFGIDSTMIERAYALPVVNFGVNAGPFLPYVLLKSMRVLRPGDIVIMPLEYTFYTYDGVPGVQMIDQIWSRDPDFFWELTFREQLLMVWMTSLERVVEGLLARGGEPVMSGPYGYQNIDAHGDQTRTSAAEAVAWEHEWTNLQKELPRRYGSDGHHQEGWAWLAHYFTWAKSQGIHLVVIPPTMMYDPFYRDDPQELRFYQGLASRVEALGVPFVGNPYDYMYPKECYFNTDYHLNDKGRARNTRRIIDDLGPDLFGATSRGGGKKAVVPAGL